MKQFYRLTFITLFSFFIYHSSAQVMTDVEGDIQISELTPSLLLFDNAVSENRLEGALFEANNHINLSSYRGDLIFNTSSSGAPSESMRILPGGQIGMGVIPAFDAKLTIQGNTGQRALILNGFPGGTEDLAVLFRNSGGTHYIFDDESDAHSFEIESANALKINTGGPSQRMEIDENGMVGINIAGSANIRLRVASGTESYGIFSQAYGIGTNKYGVYGQTVNYTAANNYYGVYGMASTTGSNSWAGYFNGDLRYTGSLVGPSDRKLKENIQEMNTVLNQVMLLKPVEYNMKRDAFPGLNLAAGRQVGFISQDVEQIFPDFVQDAPHVSNINPEDTNTGAESINIKSMNYLSFIPVLTKAIQEQQDIINQLKTQLESMQIEMDLLKN